MERKRILNETIDNYYCCEKFKEKLRVQQKELDRILKGIGGKILQELYDETGSSFLKIGCELTLGHHEKWDGSGYPQGLKGEEIPLAARIMAFADAYDAILSQRLYKDPLPIEHAESILVSEKGKHFDPVVVESYERNRDVFANIHRTYPDPQEF